MKITFVKPNVSRSPGVRPRCPHRDPEKGACLKPLHHKQGHSYSLAPSHIAQQEKPKKHSHVSKIAKLDCLQMIEDPHYRKRLLQDLRARKLRPAVECMLWYYAKGKPKEMVEHSGTLSLQQELSALTPEELRQRALDVAAMLTKQHTTVH
jgi:hypothetical protein